MSDLEQRIEQWRTELAQSQAVEASDIDELENHLREESGRLRELGLSEAEAFLVARHRLGDVGGLAQEFRKVNGDWRPLERLSWMALGALVYLLGGYVVSGVSQGGVVAAVCLGVRGYSLGVLGLALKVATAASLLALLWVACRRWSRMKSEARWPAFSRCRLGLLCGALVMTDLALIAGQLLFRLAATRTLGAAEFGRMAIVSAYAGLIWTFLAPILAAVLVIVFRAHALQRREACAAGPSE
ncbi:MAG: hypothetical protein JW955_07465 [Sedimentisphaerales bacterium]|nr:hypothetical protein [Sedimentisphaerales bacterium]